MRRNAFEYNPFADAVQLAEALPASRGLDGTVSFRPPDINPRDGTWIDRGSISWISPSDYQVNSENVTLQVDSSITQTGEINANVAVRVQTLSGLRSVLPDSKTAITVGSPVEQELNKLGLLPHLYDASNTKHADVDSVVADMVTSLLPATRPDMTTSNPEANHLRAYLARFGFSTTTIDAIYDRDTISGTPPLRTPGSIKTADAQRITREAVDKQVSQAVLRIQQGGFADTNALETWLNTGSNFKLGDTDVQRMSSSFARAISKNPANVNILLLGDPTHNRFDRVTNGNFRVENENGELRLYHGISSGIVQSATVQEILKLSSADRITRFPGLDDPTIKDIMLSVGRNATEAIRKRTP
ncbi:hypothetical protein A2Y99_00780 [Candidatus Gottesmanbacteria bacterium RBG_13_37_7]|uniref:Uncharacterized protein n=1 Tax=Candidatus Gottesmanbacteria bacterium RBG_13_37_7 TaxID=1798369 RepID=A0A1F5YK82_9BACT|nr:MAG: hypothetical protein A2Y99_00780 [Candidatus Gottesmanbacteria bacterium RBG_13_37_7]